MPDSFVGIDEPDAGAIDKRLDTETQVRGGLTVHRERVILARPGSLSDVDPASEATVASVLGQLDITLSALRDALRGGASGTLEALRLLLVALDTDVDVALSTRASEATLATLAAEDFATQATLEAVRLLLVTIRDNADGVEGLLTTIDGALDIALSSRASEATLAALNAKFNTLGQKAMAASHPVVLASDQSPVSVTQGGVGTASAPGTLTIPAAAGLVLVANANRRSVLVQNTTSGRTAHFGFGANPTTANGIRVRPGESLFEDRYTGALHAIADGADFAIPYVEIGV